MVFFCFRMEARENIGTESAVGDDSPDSGYSFQIPFAGIFTVHQFQDAWASALYGRWMCLHTLGTSAMTWSVSSLMSLGCEVVKRTRMSGTASATIRSSIGKVTVWPSFQNGMSWRSVPTGLLPYSLFVAGRVLRSGYFPRHGCVHVRVYKAQYSNGRNCLHPRMMETNPEIWFPQMREGITSR